jgi:hypothetical protein
MLVRSQKNRTIVRLQSLAAARCGAASVGRQDVARSLARRGKSDGRRPRPPDLPQTIHYHTGAQQEYAWFANITV